jgi:hypothetical protein
MSYHHKLRDIEEQKRLLVARADLQRSTFLLLTSPAFKVLKAAEIGILAIKISKAVARWMKPQSGCTDHER